MLYLETAKILPPCLTMDTGAWVVGVSAKLQDTQGPLVLSEA